MYERAIIFWIQISLIPLDEWANKSDYYEHRCPLGEQGG